MKAPFLAEHSAHFVVCPAIVVPETTGTLARKQFEILGTAAVGTLKSIATSAVESIVSVVLIFFQNNFAFLLLQFFQLPDPFRIQKRNFHFIYKLKIRR
jgi:hypothetical protein